MLKFFVGLLLGLLVATITVSLYPRFTYFKVNCDTDRFTYMWIPATDIKTFHFTCKDTNISLQQESDLYMIFQLLKNHI